MKTWTEKYRPKTIDEVEMDATVRRQLEAFELSNLPHLIISGDPGTGKTSTACILARKLLTNMEACMELNASDNRGISMISSLADNFIRKQFEDKRKIIILDEADNITKKAQEQLINVMECYPDVRFIMTCNQMSNIISGVQSRCMLLVFKRLSKLELMNKLRSVLATEKVTFETDEVLELIIMLSDHDIRCCLNYLQSLADIDENRHITIRSITSTLRVPSLSVIEDWMSMTSLDERICRYYELIRGGFCNNDIINMIICYFDRQLVTNATSSAKTPLVVRLRDRKTILEILRATHETHFKIVQTTDDELLMIQYLHTVSDLLDVVGSQPTPSSK
jgi:DNA polymerase III delta prime subunit